MRNTEMAKLGGLVGQWTATISDAWFFEPPGTTVRRLDVASDGMIWFVNSSTPRSLRPEDGRSQGVALAQRTEVAPLHDRGC